MRPPPIGSLWVVRAGKTFFGYEEGTLFLVTQNSHGYDRETATTHVYSQHGDTHSQEVSCYWFGGDDSRETHPTVTTHLTRV